MADSKKYDGSQWEHSLRKMTTATAEIEPTIYSDGTAITSYTIKGNEEHTGTPSPSNPVEVNGVGERTANLAPTSEFTNDVADTRAVLQILIRLYNGSSIIGSTAYDVTETGTFSFSSPVLASTPITRVYIKHNGSSRDIPILDINVDYPNGQFQFTADYQSINPQTVGGIKLKNIMLNYGSTAPDHYIPYGYKIPISSGGVTTNIYLGSTSGIRIIKKFVCTGAASENWGYNVSFYTSDVTDYMRSMGNITCICTHYPASGQTGGSSYVTDMTVSFLGNTNADRLYIRDSNYTSIAEFKTYLAQQYAAGTPVTVWYVLATPETGTVNEPLMKIGDYADTLSNAVSIPTTEGANTIIVDTTVQPSEFTATWTGWHDSSVKEYDGSQWQ